MKEIIITIIIVIILIILSYNISSGYIKNYNTKEKEKRNLYECGIEIIKNKGSEKEGWGEGEIENLYIKYYLIALTYLIFDIEIVLLFPYINYIISIVSGQLSNYIYQEFIILFIIFILLGLVIEYINGLFK
jgi:NADH:ubiquinone oxidoreductase subunit 3 (subunit A)